MKGRTYTTDRGEVMVHFTHISSIERQHNRMGKGHSAFVKMSNGDKYFLNTPYAEQLCSDYREWLEAN